MFLRIDTRSSSSARDLTKSSFLTQTSNAAQADLVDLFALLALAMKGKLATRESMSDQPRRRGKPQADHRRCLAGFGGAKPRTGRSVELKFELTSNDVLDLLCDCIRH
jgi:hypothetical protein